MGVCVSKNSESSESKPNPSPAPASDANVKVPPTSTDIITNTNTNTDTNTDIIDKPDNKKDQNINTDMNTTTANTTPITTTTTTTTNPTTTPATIPAATAPATATATPTATATTDTTATAPISTAIPAATATPTATTTTATSDTTAAASTAGGMTTSGTAITTPTTTASNDVAVSRSTSTSNQPIPDVPMQDQELAVRKELRELDDEELYRLLSALQSIQETNSGRMWMKMAGIHGGGIPQDDDVKLNFRNIYWCPHRKVTFPAWHRAYLAEFEYMLQLYDNKHDIDKLGRHTSKHRLMLPYWDWAASENSKFPSSVPPVLSADQVTVNIRDPITREKKSVTFHPNPLASAPARPGGAGTKPRRTRRRPTEQITIELFNRTVGSQVIESLAEPNFNAFAASSNGPYSIETPHDGVHISCGGDMWAVNTAAFDPIFWFHHNNVDRLWYAWELYHVTDTNRVYLSDEILNEELQPFSPWSIPLASSSSSSSSSGHIFPWQNGSSSFTRVRDWSDHKTLPVRYSYSYYPPAPIPRGIQMRSRRMLVVIRDVPTPHKSVDVYIYLKKRTRIKPGTVGAPSSSSSSAAATSASSSPPSPTTGSNTIDVSEHVNIAAENDGDCAGIISIFSFDMTGQDSPDEVKCVACLQRDPLTYSLDVTDFAAYLDIRNPSQGIISTCAFFVDGGDGDGDGTVWAEQSIVNNAQLVWEDDWSNDQQHIRDKQSRYLNYYGYFPRRVTYEQARHDYLTRWQLQASDFDHLMRIPRSGNADGSHDIDIRILLDILRSEIINTVQSIPQTTLSSATTESPVTIDITLQWCVTNVDTELLPYFKPRPQHPHLPILVQHLATHSFASWSQALRQYTHATPIVLRSAAGAAVELNLIWQYVTSPNSADIEITWRPMDCPGRTVGYVDMEHSRCVIALDTAEEWVLSMQPSAAEPIDAAMEDVTTIPLDQVIRHELGHCFGLHHDQPRTPTTAAVSASSSSSSSSGGINIDIRDSIMYPFLDGRIRYPGHHDASLIIDALRLA